MHSDRFEGERSIAERIGRSLGVIFGLVAFALAFGLAAAMWWAVAVAFKPTSRFVSSLPDPVSGFVALTLLVLCIFLAIRVVATVWHLIGGGLAMLCGQADGILGRLVSGFFAAGVFAPVSTSISKGSSKASGNRKA